MWWDMLIALGAGILAGWLALLVALVLMRPKGALLAEAVRLLPDLLRLLRRLAADSKLPRGVRARIVLLMVYLALPIDLIPDFLPVVGYADDAIIVAFVLRSVVRRAGIEAVRAHWPGTENGFAALARTLVPARRVGLLVVRSRPFDLVVLYAMAGSLIVLAIVVPRG